MMPALTLVPLIFQSIPWETLNITVSTIHGLKVTPSWIGSEQKEAKELMKMKQHTAQL